MKDLNKPVTMTLAVSKDPAMIKIKIPNAYNFDGSCFYALLLPAKMKAGLGEGLKDCLEFYKEFSLHRQYIAYTDRIVNGVRKDATSRVISYLESLVKAVEESLKD